MASRRGRTMQGITSRRRIAALAASWEGQSVSGPLASAREKPEPVRLQAHIDSLEAVMADQERRIQQLEAERKSLIEVEDVHRELDRFNLPRQAPGGYGLFLAERFALLKARIEAESR